MKLTHKKCQWIAGILLFLAFPVAALVPDDYGEFAGIVVGFMGWGFLIYGAILKNPIHTMGEIEDD